MGMIRHNDPARKLGANRFVAHQDSGQGPTVSGIPQRTGPASPVEKTLELFCEFLMILAPALRRPRLRVQSEPCHSLLAKWIQEICGQRIFQPEREKLPGGSLLPMGQFISVSINRIQWAEKLGAHKQHIRTIREKESI